jgi:hypothetical protein
MTGQSLHMTLLLCPLTREDISVKDSFGSHPSEAILLEVARSCMLSGGSAGAGS